MATKRQVHAASNAARANRALVDGLEGPPVEQVPGEAGIIASSASALSAWVGNVAAFLGTARTLEAKAGALETTAATLRQPTTATEDAELQRFIQTASGVEKEIGAHWTIAQTVYQFQRLLVSYRERGCGKAERARATAQRLHNGYVQAEQRRVAEENARRQREAEAEAARKRDAEAAELDRRALEAEAASADLSERERLFVQHFVSGVTAEFAAQRAGYRDKAYGGRLCAMAKIQKAVFAAREAIAAKAQAAAVREKPLDVQPVEEAAPNVTKIGTDRTSWRGECFDERLFVEAVLGGKHGIPADVLTVNQAKITEYARSLHELMNKWPGVRAVKSTTTV